MGLPQKAASLAPLTAPPSARKLRKGELLFAEGENSRAMYFLKNGIIRLFKKKGDSVIELDTVHSGQVLGELAFLDGNPRSASGEALTDCDLVEVSGAAFTQTLSTMPDWLKILLKTVVGRLRNASTRIRQLETASSAVDYSDKSGKRASNYIYLSSTDVMKGLSAMLITASRATMSPGANVLPGEIRIALLNRYGNQIMGVPVAKLATLLDLMTGVGLVTTSDDASGNRTQLKDPDFLEQVIGYLNDENLCEPSKRHDLTPRGFLLMSLINKHLPHFPRDEKTGLSAVNLAKIQETEAAAAGGKELFKLDDFTQLATFGYASPLDLRSNTEILTSLDPDAFHRAYRLQRIVINIQAINEQKRKQNAGIK